MLANLRQPPVSLDDSFFTADDLTKSLTVPFFLAAASQAPAAASPPSPTDTIDNSPQHYVAPSPQYPAQALSRVSSGISDDYMTDQFDFSNPAIRIQQSTPTPQPSFGYPQHSVLVDGAQNTNNWLFGGGSVHMPAGSSMQTLASSNRHQSHRRDQSTSSAGSNSPASPFNQGPAPQFIYSNHLPTPTHTPTQDSYIPSSFQPSFNDLNSAVTAHMAMKHALADGNSVAGEDAPDFSHSTRHSVSSFGRNSPATPRTLNGDDFDEGFRVPSNENVVRSAAQVPKLERTLTDIYSDEVFNPTSQPPTAQKPRGLTLLSPYRNAMMNERLQQANQARSQSPTSAGMRSVSPFRATSRFADSAQGFGTARQARATQQANAEANALARHGMRKCDDSEPKTISPKDAVLEYNEGDEDTEMSSLFPEEESGNFPTFASGGFQNSVSVPASAGGFGALAVSSGWTSPIGASAGSYTMTSAAPAQPAFPFAPSSVPGAFHGLATNANNFSSAGSNMRANSEETPEFPAHLTSMESSASEAPPQSSSNSNHAEIATKPSAALADTGTYTCTYHGCTQRFETPQKLQRHKREAHRQNVQQQTAAQRHTPGVGSGLTSQALLERNSQAGPHKCERINPTTGKPCNTIFSRPYDLTRHEDTIHNARKQKVRCALCQEEKTFSRNDALTRHMRVVHPDVDFPGKYRRRGGRGDD